MKLTKFTEILALIILFQIVSSFKHKRKLKKVLRSHSLAKSSDVSVFRSDYYNVCILHDNCSFFSDCHSNCDKMRVAVDYTYNCSEKKMEELENIEKLPASEKVSEISNIPYDLKKRIMKNSGCGFHYFPILERFYGRKITSPNKMRIRVINGFVREVSPDKNFYEIGEDVLQQAAIGKNMDLSFVIEQLNLSQHMMTNSIASGLPNPKRMKTHAFIDDLIDGDLKIEKTNLFIVKMFIDDIYHQVLYVCARGKNSAYHFTIDRAARDPTHENLTLIEKAKRVFQVFSKMWRTLIRVVYYAKTDSCDIIRSPASSFYSPRIDMVAQGQYNSLEDYYKWFNDMNSSFKVNGSLLKTVPEDRSSFKKLFIGVQRYALRYKKYLPFTENCQHFSTGFYNYLTNQEIPYVNEEQMSKVAKEPFAHLFTDESDEEYLEKVKVRRANAK